MCSNLLYRHYARNVPIELPRPIPADTGVGNIVCNLLRKSGDALPRRLQRLIGPLIFNMQVAIGDWPLASSTFNQITPIFGDVDAKCLVHILNRSFQDGGPILHDVLLQRGVFGGDEEGYCSFVLLATDFCPVDFYQVTIYQAQLITRWVFAIRSCVTSKAASCI